MLVKLLLLLLFLPSGVVAWLERRLFAQLATGYVRAFAWLPLSFDGELPKLTPDRFTALVAQNDAYVSMPLGDEVLLRAQPRSTSAPIVGEVELVPALLFRLRFEQTADGTWHLRAKWGPGHQLFGAALLINAVILGTIAAGLTSTAVWIAGGAVAVALVTLGVAALRYRGAARDVVGELQMDAYRRAFDR